MLRSHRIIDALRRDGPMAATALYDSMTSGAAPAFASRRHVKAVLKQMRARQVVQVKKTDGKFVVRAREENVPASYWVKEADAAAAKE